MPPVITFLSDYGLDDDFVGVCHGVIARLAPEARVLDVTHGIPPHDVRTGALVLRRSLPYFPPGVHLAVVAPGVGSERRRVALRTAEDGRLLVGPDNGLLSPAALRFGGVVEAVGLDASPSRLEPAAATSPGRASPPRPGPAGARSAGRGGCPPAPAGLARGEPLARTGVPLDPCALVA